MDPPRRPGSGWLQNTGGNSKNQPVLAPTPDGSKITRTVPLPADLVARNGGAIVLCVLRMLRKVGAELQQACNQTLVSCGTTYVIALITRVDLYLGVDRVPPLWRRQSDKSRELFFSVEGTFLLGLPS